MRNHSTFPGTPALANSIEGLADDAWAYVEIGWTLHKTSGTVIVRKNGTIILSYAGPVWPDMYPFPDPVATWTSIKVLGAQSQVTPVLDIRMCDVYLCDLTGPLHDDFLGDLIVAYVTPRAIGTYSEWTPIGEANNWQCQDDVPPNDETDYVTARVVGKRDSYPFQALAGEPIGMQLCTYCRTEVSGMAAFVPTARVGGVDYEYATFGIGDTAYTYYLQPIDSNPATPGVEWTKAIVDASEFGLTKKG